MMQRDERRISTSKHIRETEAEAVAFLVCSASAPAKSLDRMNVSILIRSRLMNDRRCPYCQQVFQPAPYHPQERVCSRPACRRQGRRDYHRQKIASDPVYRQVRLDSPRKWRQAHPGYWKQYRQTHPQRVERNRQQQWWRDQKHRLANLANNNLALDLKHSAAEVWLLGQAARHLANNNLAPCQVLIFHSPDSFGPVLPASCQQHPSGVASLDGL